MVMAGAVSLTNADKSLSDEEVDYIEIEPQERMVIAGDAIYYTAIAYDGNDEKIDYVTVDTEWEIHDNAGGEWYEAFDEDDPDYMVYFSENVGEWEVNASYEYDDGQYANATANLIVEGPEYIEIEPQDEEIKAGGSIEYGAIAYNEDDEKLGYVNESTDWKIEEDDHGGEWKNNIYTSENSSSWTVNATYTWNITIEGEEEFSEKIYDTTSLTVVATGVDSVEISPEEDQTITAGETENFSAEAYDEFDNLITDDDADFEWENTDEYGLFDETEVGEYKVNTTYEGVTSETINVTVEPAEEVDHVEISPAENFTLTAGETENFSAEAYDEYENLIEDDDMEFTWNNTDGYGLFDETEAGDYDVNATYNGVTSDTVTVTVEAAAAETVSVDIQPEETTAGETIEGPPAAYVEDEFENAVEGVNVTVDDTELDSGTYTVATNPEGIAIFDDLVIETAGNYTLTFNVDGVVEDATSDEFEVIPATVDYVLIDPNEDLRVDAEEDLFFSAEAFDAYDNLITDDDSNFTWENATDGIFSKEEIGDYNVTATKDGVSSDKVVVSIRPYITIKGEESVEAGETVAYTAELYDKYGEYEEDLDSEDVEWEINEEAGGYWDQENGNYTTEKAGTWAPIGSYTDEFEGKNLTLRNHTYLNVTPTDPEKVAIEPESDVTIESGETIDFEAEAYDEFDNLITDDDEDFEWENTDEYGLFDETEAGDYDVTATYEGVISDTVTVTVEPVEYYLTINIDGEGTVEVDGDAWADGDSDIFEEGTDVDLKAIPDEDWVFEEWTRDYEGEEAEITITMDEDKEITAVFKEEPEPDPDPASFEVTITYYDDEVEEGDPVTVEFKVENTGDVEDAQNIIFTVDGDQEATKEVTLEGGKDYTDAFTWEAGEPGDYKLTVASEDDEDTVTANVLSYYELTINIEQDSGRWFMLGERDIEGRVEVEVDGEIVKVVEDEWTGEFSEGTEVTLTATAETDYTKFDEWTGDYEGDEEEITITMDEDKEITANIKDYISLLTYISKVISSYLPLASIPALAIHQKKNRP